MLVHIHISDLNQGNPTSRGHNVYHVTNYQTINNHLAKNEPITPNSPSENRIHDCTTCCCHNGLSPRILKMYKSFNRHQIIIGWTPHCETCVCNAVFQSDTEDSEIDSSDLDPDTGPEDETKEYFQPTQHPKLNESKPERMTLTRSMVKLYTFVIGTIWILGAIALNTTEYVYTSN